MLNKMRISCRLMTSVGLLLLGSIGCGGDFYAENVDGPVVQSKCSTCHVEGGLSGGSRLVFLKGSGNEEYNKAVFTDFVNTVPAGHELILSKVRNGSGHGGGEQLKCEDTAFKDLETFLQSVSGPGGPGDTICAGAYWEGITNGDARTTLRRAAIIVTGRLPTDAEYALADQGDVGLRSALRGLMQGENFHEFLLRSANDRLHTQAFLNGRNFEVTGRTARYYPLLSNKSYNAFVADAGGDSDAKTDWNDWFNRYRFGVAMAPLELIAHIVENDLPYTDIMTAGYTMVNPFTNEIYQSNKTFSDDTDPLVFKPGVNNGQIFWDSESEGSFDQVLGRNITGHSGFIDYPHAGLLNDPAFLNRYPSTATNRNRARARWTYYHFLNFDIEKSAARTTDPEALADTDNPTLNNPSCNVCHNIHDPVAGAFQNYGDFGWYRNSYGGYDSLPATYKSGAPYTLYDTWYDNSIMLEPAFNGAITETDNSLQELGLRIAADNRFAESAVTFWWPAIMNGEVQAAPEELSDPGYGAKLNAYNIQQDAITTFAGDFSRGFYGGSTFNLKDLLVEMMMSPWFRAESTDTPLNADRSTALADVGVDRLLTPEELAIKTKSLFGFAWGETDAWWQVDPRYTKLKNKYRIYYGGIDSEGITERARELNALMSNVALAQALSVSCPAVTMDFNRPEQEKLLFQWVDRHITPVSQAHEQFVVTGIDDTAPQFSTELSLTPGDKELRFSFDNKGYDANVGSRRVYIDHFTVTDPDGEVVISLGGESIISAGIGGEVTSYLGGRSGYSTGTAWTFADGYMHLPITITKPGLHQVTLNAYGVTLPDGIPPMISVVFNGLDPYGGNPGETLIKAKLQALHFNLLGEAISWQSEELSEFYRLFVETWQNRWTDGSKFYAANWPDEVCQAPTGVTLSTDDLADPQHTLGVWAQMLTYLMTDYNYLHE